MDKWTSLMFLVLCSICLAVVGQVSDLPAEHLGFFLGLLVFGINIILMVFLGKKLLESFQNVSTDEKSPDSRSPDQNSNKKTKKGLMAAPGLFILKFVLIGAGAYIAIVVQNASAMYFVAGALAALACYTGAAYGRMTVARKWLK